MKIDKKTLIVAVVVVLAAALFLLRDSLFSEARSDREVLLAQIDEVAAAAERRDLKAITEQISESYTDQQGRGRQELVQYLRAMFVLQKQISAYIVNKDVELSGPRSAAARVDAVLTRGPRVEKLADIIPESARAFRFTLRFVKEGADWRLGAAEWTPVSQLRELIQ